MPTSPADPRGLTHEWLEGGLRGLALDKHLCATWEHGAWVSCHAAEDGKGCALREHTMKATHRNAAFAVRWRCTEVHSTTS